MITDSFDNRTPAIINPRIGKMTKSSAAGSVIGRSLRRFSLRYFDLFANMISLLKR